jgi:putative flippase GtrA
VNTFVRWTKFNLVGALGMVVQLVLLAVLNRRAPGHFLLTSAAAVEVALLHNFVWHLRYTWVDRRNHSGRFAQLARFHLSNGLVSLLGNLLLTPILVKQAQLPVLAANFVSILCCSVINFLLGDSWAFPGDHQAAISR